MAAGEIRAGKAYVELGLKDQFSKALDKSAAKLKAFGRSVVGVGKVMAGIGGALVAPLLVASKAFANMGSEIADAAARTGVAGDVLSKLKFAAEQSGASFGDLESSIRKMGKTIAEAGDGSKSAVAALGAIGLSAADLKGLKPEEQFKLIADQLAKVEKTGDRSALAMDVFGKSGSAMLPLLSEGSKGITKLTDAAAEFGLVMTNEDIEAADAFGDALDVLVSQFKVLVFQGGAAIAEVLRPFVDGTVRVLAAIIQWAKENRRLAGTILAVGLGLIVAGAAVVTAGILIASLGAIITGVMTVAGALTAVIGAVAGVFTIFANPIGVVTLAIGGLIAAFAALTGGATTALNFITEKLGQLKEIAGVTVAGIADALAAGDIQLAASILWTGLKAVWLTGVSSLNQVWAGFKERFVQVAGAAFYGALEIWANVKADLLSAFEVTTTALSSTWDAFIGVFSDLWNGAYLLVIRGLNAIKGAWDDTFDSEAANKAAQKEVDDAAAARVQKEIDNRSQSTSERDANLEQIEADRKAAIESINKREMELSEGASLAANEEIKALEDQRKAMLEQLQAQRQLAKENKDAAQWSQTPIPTGKREGDDDDDLLERIEPLAKRDTPGGVFNVGALQSLLGGGAGIQERIASAAEQTAKNTRKLANEGGMAFG